MIGSENWTDAIFRYDPIQFCRSLPRLVILIYKYKMYLSMKKFQNIIFFSPKTLLVFSWILVKYSAVNYHLGQKSTIWSGVTMIYIISERLKIFSNQGQIRIFSRNLSPRTTQSGISSYNSLSFIFIAIYKNKFQKIGIKIQIYKKKF